MSDRFLQLMPNNEKARKRLRIGGRFVFAMLALHFVLVYVAPQMLKIPQRSIVAESRRVARTSSSGRSPHAAGERLVKRNGKRFIWGGKDPSMHFPAQQLRIDPSKLQYGLGREAFPALIEPKFISADRAEPQLPPEERVLAVSVGDEVKVYPIELLKRHEVVNDVVGGKPIFAAYCVLADLGAVYDRRIAGHTLTFAVSGYTYGEKDVWDGRQAFVLWDRDTESLWWPPEGKAVAGPLVDTPMKVFDEAHWSQTTWGEVRERHPEARVLKRGQDMQPPQDFPKRAIRSASAATRPSSQPSATAPGAEGEVGATTQVAQRPTTRPGAASDLIETPDRIPDHAIAPRWGENSRLEGE